MAKLCWSKNVNEEQECPHQIIFASMVWESCLFFVLVLHLETSIMTHGYNHENKSAFNSGKTGVYGEES